MKKMKKWKNISVLTSASILVMASTVWAQPNVNENPVLSYTTLDASHTGHGNEDFNIFRVGSFAWSPDGKTLAIAGEALSPTFNETPPWSAGIRIQMWDVSKRECRHVFAAGSWITELDWSPDNVFIVGRSESDAQIWNLFTGQYSVRKALTIAVPVIAGIPQIITGTPQLVAERDVYAILRSERQADKNVCVMERRSLSTGETLSTHLFTVRVGGVEREAECVALSRDGKQLVKMVTSPKNELTFNIFDTQSSKLLRSFVVQNSQLPSHPDPSHQTHSDISSPDFHAHLAFSRNGSTLALAVACSSLLLLNARTGAQQGFISTPDDVEAFTISSDGTRIAVCEINSRVTLWNGFTGKFMGEISPKTILFIDSPLYTQTLDTQSLIRLAFSPDSATLAVAYSGETVSLYHIR